MDVIIGVIIAYVLIAIFFWIPEGVLLGRLFVKAGRPFWAAFVPVYNLVVMAKIGKTSPVWGVIGGLFWLPTNSKGVIKLLFFVGVVAILYVLRRFILQFDKGIGWWLGFVFVPFIMVFLKDNARYKGGADWQTAPAAAAPNQFAAPQTPQPQAPQQYVAPPAPPQNYAPPVIAPQPPQAGGGPVNQPPQSPVQPQQPPQAPPQQ